MLDEIDASTPEVLVILNAAIANRYFDFPTGRVEAHEGFRLVAAGNTYGTGADIEYTGRYQLDAASLDRFAIIEIDYDQNIEEVIAKGDKELVSFIRDVRKAISDAKIKFIVSYRAIDRLSKLKTIFSKEEAIRIALIRGMDKEDVQIIARNMPNSNNDYLREFKKNNMSPNIIIERFSSITELANIVGRRKPNSVFRVRTQASEDKGDEFSLTNSYEESIDLLMNGYKDGLANLEASSGERISHRQSSFKNIPSVGVVGYVPHIPNAITGIPHSMITTTPVEQRAKVVTILYDMGSNGGTSAKRFITAGRNLLNAILTLELNGYRVGLSVVLSFCTNREQAFCVTQIKNHRQPSNPLKIAYPILHPAFFRRQGFKWIETCLNLTNNEFTDGYGRTLRWLNECGDIDSRRQYLRKHGILEQGCFYTEFEEAEKNPVDKLIELMGIKENIKQ